MKKIVGIFLIFILYSCSCTCDDVITPEDIEAIEEATTKDIEIVFTTTEPNYDEVMVTYYDYEIEDDFSSAFVFKYDTSGNPLPLKITLDNYKYEFIRGEGFRNNFSTAQLKVQLFVDDEMVLENTSNGTSNAFAKVNFDFDIPD